MKHGVLKIKPDHRDFDFNRTFRLYGGVSVLPVEFNLDAGLSMPDQNTDGLPEGCTSYAQTDLCSDEDRILYQQKFTYQKTLYMDNLPPGSPCNIRTSLNSTIVYGTLATGETTDAQALNHRRGQYFSVQPSGDWFDGIRVTLMTNRSVSIGTPWPTEWETPLKGVIPQSFTLTGKEPWHNWVICGWKQVNNVPFLIGRTWQGKNYGDGGLAYFSRETINAVMKISGTGAFTLAQANPQNIQNVRLTLMQTLLSYYYRLENFYAKAVGSIVGEVS